MANRLISIDTAETAGAQLPIEVENEVKAVISADKGQANGYAPLDGAGKLPAQHAPDIAVVDYLGAVASQAAMLALVGQKGDWATRTDLGTDWQIIADNPALLASWRQMTYPASPVPVNRTIATTNGLSGGGDLSADRTIQPVYGTAANTVCEGNDARLADTRTPTDGSVTTAKFAGSALVTSGEGLSSSNNDTSVPTTAAVLARFVPRVGSTTSSATPTINTDNVDAYSITALAVAITSMTTNLSGTPTNFQRLLIRIKDDGSARTIAWGASFEAGSVALPTTTVAGKTLLVGLIYDSVDGKWACEASASRA